MALIVALSITIFTKKDTQKNGLSYCTQNNDIHYIDTQHNGLNCDTQHNNIHQKRLIKMGLFVALRTMIFTIIILS